MPWRLDDVSPDGRALTVRYERGTCDRFERIETAERAKTVSLEVLAVREDSEMACDAVLRTDTATVRLRAPLGSRKLVHGPVQTIRP